MPITYITVLCSACLLLQVFITEGCDYLTAYTSSATLQSDNYPQAYNPDTSQCWIIVANNTSHQIQISTIEFVTEANSDIVRVHDGDSDSATALASWSGYLYSHVVLSSGSTVYISFTSDLGLQEKGFQLQYSSTNEVLGSCFLQLATDAERQLSSPGYPLYYPNDLDICWVIQTGSNSIPVHILFESIQLEMQGTCDADYIVIRQGETSSSPLLGTYCQSDVPDEIIVAGGSAYIRFTTDYLSTNAGFQLTYSTQSLASDTTEGGCGFFTASATPAYIKSPDYPFNYQAYTDICYVILSPSPDQQVKLEVLDSHLEAPGNTGCYDYIRVRDGSEVSSPVLREWCGTDAQQGTIITSTASALYIEFHSDENLQERGFNIEYTLTQVEEELTKLTAFMTPVTLSSPGYPSNYQPNQDLYWLIESPNPAERVKLTIQHLQIQDSTDCTADYLEIRDGSHEYSVLQERLCGTYSTDQVFISSGRELHLQFHSDGSQQQPGFTGVFQLYSSNTADECTTYDVGDEMLSFTSPLYPSEYPASLYMCWQLIGADRQRNLHVVIVEMQLESSTNCNSDFLEITDGYDPDFAPTLGRWCGDVSYVTVETSQSVAHILFVTDGSRQFTGFRVEFYQPQEESSNSTLIIVVGVVVAVIVVAAIIAGVFCFIKSRKTPASNMTTTDGRMPTSTLPTVSEGVYLEPVPSQPKADAPPPYNHYTGTPTHDLDRPFPPSMTAAHSTPHLYEYPMDNDAFVPGTPPGPGAPSNSRYLSERIPQDPNLRFSSMDNPAFDRSPRTPTPPPPNLPPPNFPPAPPPPYDYDQGPLPLKYQPPSYSAPLASPGPLPASPGPVSVPASPEPPAAAARPIPAAPRESYAIDNAAFEPSSPSPSDLNLSGEQPPLSPAQELIGQPSLSPGYLDSYVRQGRDNRAYEQ